MAYPEELDIGERVSVKNGQEGTLTAIELDESSSQFSKAVVEYDNGMGTVKVECRLVTPIEEGHGG